MTECYSVTSVASAVSHFFVSVLWFELRAMGGFDVGPKLDSFGPEPSGKAQ